MEVSVCSSLDCKTQVVLPGQSPTYVPSACCAPFNLADIHGKTKAEVEAVVGAPDGQFPQCSCLAYYLGGGLCIGYTGQTPVATVITVHPANLALNAAAILSFFGLSRFNVGAFSGSDFVSWNNDPTYGNVTALADPENPGKVFCIDILGIAQ